MGTRLAGLIVATAMTIGAAHAEDLKLAIGQRGNWDSGVAELGQRAGIFKKHGLTLDLLYTQGGGETQQAVISGSVDMGVAVGILGLFGAATKGAPVRIIGAQATGSSDFWYVPTDSSVKSIKDIDGRTIGYSTNGSSTNSIVLAMMESYGLKPKPVATGSAPATFTQVMSGQIDVGWSSPPFGFDALDQGRIRLLARGNDLPQIKVQTTRVLIANAACLDSKRALVATFLAAYRETIDWMYASPDALETYAAFAKVPIATARRIRDEFIPKEMLDPDQISGIDVLMADGVNFKFFPAPLSEDQLAKLVQIPPRTP